MRWFPALPRWLRPQPSRPVWDAAALRPDPPICIIGDLHGRLDLLERMLGQIAARPGADRARKIVVGDMIDRGPDSIGVLRRLYGLCVANPRTTLCLMGNHERMMLDFLADPDRHGPRWIAAGGAQTLASAGVHPWGRTPMPELAAQLRAVLDPGMLDWLAALPLYWQEADIAVTHAGASPALDLASQSAARLLWGAQGVDEKDRRDGIWIAQGHDIVPRACLDAGRIMVDTGAWRSGMLSAVWLDATGPCVIETRLPSEP